MIDKRILQLTPKRILCPLCGEWHDWEGKTLQSYDEANSYEYECNDVTVSIWVDEDHIHIYADSPCDKLNSEIDVDADLRDMEYDGTDPVIKIPFSLNAKTANIVIVATLLRLATIAMMTKMNITSS